MAGLSPLLTKGFRAGAAVPRRRIVKFGADNVSVLIGAAATDLLLGISAEIDADAGQPCDIHLQGIASVEFGGNVTRGDLLTSDANGRAVAVAPAAGANVRSIGIALASGVANDIGPCLISQSRPQG